MENNLLVYKGVLSTLSSLIPCFSNAKWLAQTSSITSKGTVRENRLEPESKLS